MSQVYLRKAAQYYRLLQQQNKIANLIGKSQAVLEDEGKKHLSQTYLHSS